MTTPTLREAAMAALKALSVVTSTLMRPEKHMEVVRDLRLALTAPEQSPADGPAAPTSGEPVAWQWRRKGQPWTLANTFNTSVFATTEDSEVRALYAAAPAATPPSAAQAEGARDLAKRIKAEAAHWAYMAEIDNSDAAQLANHNLGLLVDQLAALTAAPEKLEGPSVAFPFRIGSRKLLRRGHAQGLLRELGKWMQREAVGDVEAMELVSAYIDALEQAGQEKDEFETRADGKRVRKDRWQWGIRRIVALLWGNRHEFEVDEVVEAVRKLLPTPFANGEDEALVERAHGIGITTPKGGA